PHPVPPPRRRGVTKPLHPPDPAIGYKVGTTQRPPRKAKRMRSVLTSGLVFLAVSSGAARAADAPKPDAPPAVVELLEDDADLLVKQFDNQPGGEAGEAAREAGDKYSGTCSVRVTPTQRYRATLPGWSFPVVEKPRPGEYRYVRFAWKKVGGTGIMIQFHGSEGSWWHHRYVAGANAPGGASVQVGDKAPAGWVVVTRDLFKDFGAFTLTGMALTPMDGTAGLYDHVYLGRTVEDLDRVSAAGLGKEPLKE